MLPLLFSLFLAGDVPIQDPPAKPKGPRNVAILVHEGVELLDFAGPGEVFAVAGNGQAFRVYTVAASKDPITSQRFLKVTPEFTFDDCPKPDIVVIPGGSTRIPLANPKVVEWVKRVSTEAEVTMSVCTGAFILARAGLLDNQEATTHWGSIAGLKTAAPGIKVRADRRFTDNGKVVTTAGVSAGIDGSLHVVQRLLGDEAARTTARYMEYRWEPEKK
jgi:transcriptional regulator GlxA family with amidase domain